MDENVSIILRIHTHKTLLGHGKAFHLVEMVDGSTTGIMVSLASTRDTTKYWIKGTYINNMYGSLLFNNQSKSFFFADVTVGNCGDIVCPDGQYCELG